MNTSSCWRTIHGYVLKSSIHVWKLSPNSFRIPLYQGFNLQDLYHILMSIHSVGQSTLGDFSDKIHHRYKYTTQEGHFSPFPQSTSSNTEVVKVYTRKIESICYCGKPDVFQNMVGCEAKRGRVKCSKWVHQSCSGVSGDWFCDEHRDCWFCYMYWYFNCIIFKWMTCWCLEFLIFCFMYFYWTWVVFTCEIK